MLNAKSDFSRLSFVRQNLQRYNLFQAIKLTDYESLSNLTQLESLPVSNAGLPREHLKV